MKGGDLVAVAGRDALSRSWLKFRRPAPWRRALISRRLQQRARRRRGA